MEYLSLKPNREILNAGFNSYHLGTESLEVKSLNLLEPVAYYPLTEEHYSYSHLRAHTAQNLLILDRWNEEEDTLYFIDKTFSIMGVTYNKVGKHMDFFRIPNIFFYLLLAASPRGYYFQGCSRTLLPGRQDEHFVTKWKYFPCFG